MPIETGDYQELHGYKIIIESGLYKSLTHPQRSLLLLLNKHANWPSGWTWPGKTRAEREFGLNVKTRYRAYCTLGSMGLFTACGLKKTKGGLVLAVRLSFEVPKNKVPNSLSEALPNWDKQVVPLASSLTGTINILTGTNHIPNWDNSVIEKAITLKNPKEPSRKVEDKSSSEKQDLESLIKEHCARLNNLANSYSIIKALQEIPKEYHFRIKAFLSKRYPHKNEGLTAYNNAKELYELKYGRE